MKINKSYKFRLYPTKDQEQLLLQHVGNSRFMWNKLVEFNTKYKEENKKFPNQLILQKEVKKLKKEFDFTKLTHSQPLQINAKRLFQVNLKSVQPQTVQERKVKISKAKLKPKKHRANALKKAFRYGFPNFKRKSDMSGSLFYPQNFKMKRSRMFFAKLGWIKYIKHRNIEGIAKTATIMQDGEQWYVTICCEMNIKLKPKLSIENSNIVGIDVGIKEFATVSNGEVIHNPKTLKKYKDKLAKEQRKLSRKQYVDKEIKGETKKVSSNNRDKQKTIVRKIHRKIKNTRKDFLHKTSHHMITKYDGIILETLSIKSMLQKNGKAQNRNTCDVSWYEFSRMLEYKCLWKSKYFHKIDQYFCSTQLCSKCGNKQEMPQEVRIYSCQACGNTLDRDYNASLNILKEGVSELKKNTKNTTVGTMGSYACGQEPLGDWMKQEKREMTQAIA